MLVKRWNNWVFNKVHLTREIFGDVTYVPSIPEE